MPTFKGSECLCGSRETDSLGVCEKCWELNFLALENNPLGKKAEKIFEVYNAELISQKVFTIKRDRILYLRKIANDKYLTKIKAEVMKM